MFHPKLPGATRALAAALMLTLALPGCVSFGGKPPSKLLALDAALKVPAGTLRSGGQGGPALVVADPDSPKMLDTVRVPVQVSPTSLAYVTDAQWADTPRHLFQKLLAETIGATSNRFVLDPGQYSAQTSQRLMGDLIQFNIVASGSMAVVTYDALLTSPTGAPIARQRFTASAPVDGKIDATTIGAPLNTAANKVAADVAAWVATQGDK